jgi:hypothetical protein
MRAGIYARFSANLQSALRSMIKCGYAANASSRMDTGSFGSPRIAQSREPV